MRTGPVTSGFARRVQGFINAEHGTSTIEFVFMVPLFTTLMLLVTDASLLFLRHSELLNISRDTARIVSRHGMSTSEAESYATAAARTNSSIATARVTVQDGYVTVQLSTDATSAAPFGIISFAVGDKLAVSAISAMEPI